MPPSLIPLPPRGSPIRTLERLWLRTTFVYEELAANIMADEDWDKLGLELWKRREEWSPYFRHCLPSEDFNPGTTGSGLDWNRGLGKIFADHLRGLDGDYSSLYANH